MTNTHTLQNKMKEDIAQQGFTIHYVYSSPSNPKTPHQPAGIPTRMDIHTHGLGETYKHRELQIVVPIEPRVARSIFHNMINQIKNGTTFEPNKTYEGILKNSKILILENPETDNTPKNERGEKLPLRIILPDPKGKIPTPKNPSSTYPIYSQQVSFP